MRSRIASGMAGILILLMLACNLPITQTPVIDASPLSSPIVESITLSPSQNSGKQPAIGTDVIGPGEETAIPAVTLSSQPSLTTSAVTHYLHRGYQLPQGSGGDV